MQLGMLWLNAASRDAWYNRRDCVQIITSAEIKCSAHMKFIIVVVYSADTEDDFQKDKYQCVTRGPFY